MSPVERTAEDVDEKVIDTILLSTDDRAGAAADHDPTGSGKFSAKVAGARIKYQADTWCTS